jgi:hypothetical protein
MKKLTYKQVRDLSDTGLTKGIAKLLGLCPIVEGNKILTTLHYVHVDGTVDYLNNWNDLMPLVEKYNIGSGFWGNKAQAYRNDVDDCYSISLQRAYAECLYLILQEETDND